MVEQHRKFVGTTRQRATGDDLAVHRLAVLAFAGRIVARRTVARVDLKRNAIRRE